MINRTIHGEANLNRKFVEMMKLLNIYLNHFPRHEKYALCSRIRNTAYQIYDLITEAQKRYHKKTTLVNLDITHEQLRMQMHLANELGYLGFKDGRTNVDGFGLQSAHRYIAISTLIDELGRMIGGWMQADKGKVLS
ncbi:MAG: four helix bundle protein [Alphaproteobacteria bacterium]|nr:four helix bundle protein [Alphaproteobacteria bacterium]